MAEADVGGVAVAAAAPAPAAKLNAFLLRTPENADHNQYWFSTHTIDTIIKELEVHATRVAFVSTPSVYFSLAKSSALARSSMVFDIDTQWKEHPNVTFYDFGKPEEVPETLHHQFDFVLCDPPFITAPVLTCYATSIKLLLAPGGRVLFSTVSENAALLKQLLGLKELRFLPSVPHLVYQFSFFASYDSELLSASNPELPDQ